ncbi:MAG: dephospho-CoA kinase [Lachnospiraceae bacterium]|nr:dephospho-CoA kinase [Lachnospiraceae bacterium]
MKIIGITGGVGSGKSRVLNEISNRCKCIILFADEIAKDLEKPGEKCYKDIVDLLGKEILDEDGRIVNKLMASKIYEDNSLLEKVNNIIHPAVRTYIIEEIAKARHEGLVDYFFIEAALLIECGYNEVVDEMWYIFAREDIRRKRLKESRGYTEEKIDSIMKSQLSENEFKTSSDILIDNSDSIEETMLQIAKVTKDSSFC